MGKVKPKYGEAFDKIKYEYQKLIDKQFETIRNYINRKLNSYFIDIQNQSKNVQPLTEEQKINHNKAFEKIEAMKLELKQLEGNILQTYSGIINKFAK